MNVEDAVRVAVRDLADEARPPHDLAAVARGRGRRLRRRRRAGLGVLAVVVAALAVTPYAVLRPDLAPDAGPPPAATAAPGDLWQRPYVLPGGAIVTALGPRDAAPGSPSTRTGFDGNLLLDRSTGRYTALSSSYHTIWGAPVGGRAAVTNGRGDTGVIDANGGARWHDSAMDPVWSSDGTRILISTDRGFQVMDAATGDIAVRNTPMELCPDRCTFSWLPGDLEVAIGRRDPAAVRLPGRPDTVKDVAIYAVATGKPVRVVPVPGEPVRQDAWSSDGRLVLAYDRSLGEPFRVVEVRSGRTVGRIAGQEVHFLPDDRILALTNETAELYDSAGRLVQKRALPDDLRDRQLSIGRS